MQRRCTSTMRRIGRCRLSNRASRSGSCWFDSREAQAIRGFNLPRRPRAALLVAVLLAVPVNGVEQSEPAKPGADRKTVRVAACQAKRRSIDWRLKKPADVLAAVDRNLAELEKIVHKAGEQKCDVLSFPEDTLGLLDWAGVNEAAAKEVLPKAVKRMLDRLG